MATMHESARHGSHKADDNFSAFQWESKAQVTVVYQFQQWYKLDSGAVVEESCYATKRGSPQSGREGDDAIVIFQVAGVRCVSGVASAYGRYKFMEKFDVYTEY